MSFNMMTVDGDTSTIDSLFLLANGASGVAVETIRFYEAQGLLPAPLRLENNYRNYTRRHLARLHFIRHCRLLDMSLEEIAKLANMENAQPC